MKAKSARFLIVTILLSGIFIVSAWYWFGIFTPYNAFAAKRDIEKGNVHFLYYGEMDPRQKLVDSIAGHYGFGYRRVDDCNVNDVLINGVKRYNMVVGEYMCKCRGKDWEVRFREDLNNLKDMDR